MNHPFTVIWIGDKLPDHRPILQAGEEARCVCEICERSWIEHGKPEESEWEWRACRRAEVIADAPWGVFDPSWFHYLCKMTLGEIEVFLVFVNYRNGESGESAPGVANVMALTGLSKSSADHIVSKFVKVGLLTLLRKHTGKSNEHNVYSLPPTTRHDEIMAKFAQRKATTNPKRPSFRGNDVAVPRPSQDAITPDLPEGDRSENLRRLREIGAALPVKTVPMVAKSRCSSSCT